MQAVGSSTPASRNIARAFFRRTDASAIIATVVLFVRVLHSTQNFFTPFNQFNVWRAASQNVFIALGQAMVVLIGGMNLSLGAIGGLTVVILGHSIEILGFAPWVAVIFGLAVGVAVRCDERLLREPVQAELFRRDPRHELHLPGSRQRHLAGPALFEDPRRVHRSGQGRRPGDPQHGVSHAGGPPDRLLTSSATRWWAGGCWPPAGTSRRHGFQASRRAG